MESWLERLRALALPPRPAVVDGGANKGAVTERFLALWPDCRVTAFEPQPRLARKLTKRFADEPRVAVRPVALGEAPATLPLTILARPTLSSLLPPTGIRKKYAGQDLPVTDTVEVPVVRLDAVVPRADVIKLDVQGSELPALRGASGLLPGVTRGGGRNGPLSPVCRPGALAGHGSLSERFRSVPRRRLRSLPRSDRSHRVRGRAVYPPGNQKNTHGIERAVNRCFAQP